MLPPSRLNVMSVANGIHSPTGATDGAGPSAARARTSGLRHEAGAEEVPAEPAVDVHDPSAFAPAASRGGPS
jgi:hypothetical protein